MGKRLFAVVVLLLGISICHAGDLPYTERIKVILLSCRHPGDPTPMDSLRSFAAANELTNAEMADLLMQLVRPGIDAKADSRQRDLAAAAFWGLAIFGGEEEYSFVSELIHSTNDTSLQKTAVRVVIRMMSEKWEEWVRTVASEKRFDSLTRFDAYEEAYRIGMNGDERTRQQVEKVLSEFMAREATSGNSTSMQRWINELEAR